MKDWLNKYFGSLIYVIVAVISGVSGLIITFNSRLAKLGNRTTKIETLLENTHHRLDNLEQLSGKVYQLERKLDSFPPNTNFAQLIDDLKILTQEVSKLTDNLRNSEITSENDIKVPAPQKHTKTIPKVPICEISVLSKSKSKTRPVRTRKKSKIIPGQKSLDFC